MEAKKNTVLDLLKKSHYLIKTDRLQISSLITVLRFLIMEKNTWPPALKKGVQYFQITSKNILNDKCKAVYFKNTYKIDLVNTIDKNAFDVDFDVVLNISTKAWHHIEEIESKYNVKYTPRTVEELSKKRIFVLDKIKGIESYVSNEIQLNMILKKGQAFINSILREYDSHMEFNFRKFTPNPSKSWTQFYFQPIVFIKTIFNNSHNLVEK